MSIVAVEDALIAECKRVFGNTVKSVESLPGGWTMDMMQRALQFSPSVFVAYQGSTPGADYLMHKGRFTVYVCTNGPDEAQRRRGNQRVIGAYDMIERLLPALPVLTIQGVGIPKLTAVENLFRDAMFEIGGTVYGIQLEISNMCFAPIDESSLDDFITWNSESQVGGDETPNVESEFTVRSED